MEIFLSFFSQIISAKARLNFSPFFLRCFFHPSPSFQPLKKIVCFLPFVLNWIKKKRKKTFLPLALCRGSVNEGKRKSRNEKRAWAFHGSEGELTLAGDIESFRYPSSKEKQRERKVLSAGELFALLRTGWRMEAEWENRGVTRVMGTKKRKKNRGIRRGKGWIFNVFLELFFALLLKNNEKFSFASPFFSHLKSYFPAVFLLLDHCDCVGGPRW